MADENLMNGVRDFLTARRRDLGTRMGAGREGDEVCSAKRHSGSTLYPRITIRCSDIGIEKRSVIIITNNVESRGSCGGWEGDGKGVGMLRGEKNTTRNAYDESGRFQPGVSGGSSQAIIAFQAAARKCHSSRGSPQGRRR